MLSEKQRKDIEAAIREKLTDIDQKIVEYKELTKPIPPENAIGRVSRMDAINNKSVNEAALRQAEFKRKRMKEAITKIEEPYFGTCRGCGQAIPLGRLMLMPEATRCVNCAR